MNAASPLPLPLRSPPHSRQEDLPQISLVIALAEPQRTPATKKDEEIFRALYLQHRGLVASVVKRMIHNPAEVDDVIQDVFIQVHRSLKDFRGDSLFTTWLYRVAINVVRMHKRALKSRPQYVPQDEEHGDRDGDVLAGQPDDDAERKARIQIFISLLDTLSEKKREVFTLHVLEGLSFAKIAAITKTPILTVRTRLHYARKDLEALVAKESRLQ